MSDSMEVPLSASYKNKAFVKLENDDGPEQISDTQRNDSITPWSSVKFFLFESKLNILGIALPLGFISGYARLNSFSTFLLNFLAIVPLSKIMGTATEELALRTSPAIGALLNATFGNAIELIISILALNKNLIRVVQASLLGSILSNILLVLGLCFFCGGLKYKLQSFNNIGAQTSAGLLSLTVLAILIPAAFDLTTADSTETELAILTLSRGTSVLLLITYIAYVYFQLKTHKHLYEDDVEQPQADHQISNIPLEELEQPHTLLWVSLCTLVVITILVSLAADLLVSSIEPIAEEYKISTAFVSLILIPIVGNAAEHMTAVTVAMKNKMEIAVGVAIGSSIQIALLVLPITVLVGWIMGKNMSLDFAGFESFCLFGGVSIVNYIIADGQSNWLEGLMLLCSYLIIAIAFWTYPEI